MIYMPRSGIGPACIVVSKEFPFINPQEARSLLVVQLCYYKCTQAVYSVLSLPCGVGAVIMKYLCYDNQVLSLGLTLLLLSFIMTLGL